MITEKIIISVKKKLIQAYDPVAIYLFGSYAWGTPSEESDLDLLIVIENSNEKTYIRPVVGHKALADLDISKDIIVYTKKEFEALSSRPASLCSKIKKDGRIIYARA